MYGARCSQPYPIYRVETIERVKVIERAEISLALFGWIAKPVIYTETILNLDTC